MSITKLNSDISNAKNVSSGLVEWNDNSLNAIAYDIFYLLLSNVAKKVANTASLSGVSVKESRFAVVANSGIYQYKPLEPTSGEYYDALGGGYWVNVGNYKADNHYLTPLTSNQEQTITDVSPYPDVPLGGESLVQDNGTWVFAPISVYDGVSEKNDILRYNNTTKRWNPYKSKVVFAGQNQNYTLTYADDVVTFEITSATTKTATLPTLTSAEIGKKFTIISLSSFAGSKVNVSYNSNVIADIQPSLGFAGITFTSAYRSLTLVWDGSGYNIIKRS